MNKKAQSFESFRLLIAVIISLIVGATIYSVIQYFQELEFSSSIEKISRGMQKALNSVYFPDEKGYIEEEGIKLKKGTYIPGNFIERAFIPVECVNFEGKNTKAYKIRSDGSTTLLDVLYTGEYTLYFRCENTPCNLLCNYDSPPSCNPPLDPGGLKTHPITCKIYVNYPPE